MRWQDNKKSNASAFVVLVWILRIRILNFRIRWCRLGFSYVWIWLFDYPADTKSAFRRFGRMDTSIEILISIPRPAFSPFPIPYFSLPVFGIFLIYFHFSYLFFSLSFFPFSYLSYFFWFSLLMPTLPPLGCWIFVSSPTLTTVGVGEETKRQ